MLHWCLASRVLKPVLMLAILWPTAVVVGDEPSRPTAEPRVICPAIESDERPRTNSPFEPEMPIGLIVVGTAVEVEKGPGGDNVYEAKISQVLYGGGSDLKAIRFSHPWAVGEGPRIFALVPAVYAEKVPYQLKYSLDAREAPSQQALARARLDYQVLSSPCIFVGKEISFDGEYRHRVQPIRTLSGPALPQDKAIRVEIGGYIRHANERPTARPQPMIYLIEKITTDREDRGSTYVLSTRLPADCEPVVLDAIKRREQYPIREIRNDGKTQRVREILFQGTLGEAMELMGSSSSATVELASSTLAHQREKAIPVIAVEIQNDLLRQDEPNPGRFRKLHHLIQLLGTLEEGKPTGRLGKFVEQFLGHLAAHPAPPPQVKRPDRDTYWDHEEAEDDVNHALVWLLMALDQEEVLKHYADRLFKLREAAKDPWKAEIQLALDVCRVEDNLELGQALARMKGQKPLSILPAFGVTEDTIAFSTDGKLVATGTRVYNLEDGSPAGGVDLKASLAAIAFSPDHRLLYVFGRPSRRFQGLPSRREQHHDVRRAARWAYQEGA